LKEGLSREELRITLGDYINPRLFNKAVRDLEVDGKIVAEKENVRIEGHRVNLKDEEMRLREEIAGIYRISGLTPPSKKEIMEKFPKERNIVTNLLTVMINTKTLVKVNEDLYFLQRVHRQAEKRL